MKVILHDSVFSPPRNETALYSIFHFAFTERHRVLLFRDNGKEWSCWRDAQRQEIRDELEFALETSISMEQFGRDVQTIHVEKRGGSDWSLAEPCLSATDACDFLSTPLSIQLENSRNDRDFLLTFAHEETRRAEVESAIRRRWIVFHGGGMGEVSRAVQEMRGDRASVMRSWVMFDSDALEPGKPSAPSMRLSRQCEETAESVAETPSRFFHRLSRRAIENYIPPKSLVRAMKGSQLAKARAFSRLPDAARWCLCMKEGLYKDTDDLRCPPPVFRSVGTRARKLLSKGFGKGLAELMFSSEGRASVERSDIDLDGSLLELQPAIESMLRRL